MNMSGQIHSGVEEIIEPKKLPENNNHLTILKDNLEVYQPLVCEICNVRVTSPRIFQRHVAGKKHIMRIENQGKVYRCELCDITANSAAQLNIHIASSKHKSRIYRKERAEFTNLTPTTKGICLLAFCGACLFVNLLLLFKLFPN